MSNYEPDVRDYDEQELAEYEQGYEVAYRWAEEFIERHPAGMPWAALPEEEESVENAHEHGQRDGWTKRISEEEGWPTTRREVRGQFPRPTYRLRPWRSAWQSAHRLRKFSSTSRPPRSRGRT